MILTLKWLVKTIDIAGLNPLHGMWCAECGKPLADEAEFGSLDCLGQ